MHEVIGNVWADFGVDSVTLYLQRGTGGAWCPQSTTCAAPTLPTRNSVEANALIGRLSRALHESSWVRALVCVSALVLVGKGGTIFTQHVCPSANEQPGEFHGHA